MKYKYNKLNIIILATGMIAFGYYMSFHNISGSANSYLYHSATKKFLGGFTLLLGYAALYLPAYLNRSVRLTDSMIFFDSFQEKKNLRKILNCNFSDKCKYSSINKIEYKRKYLIFPHIYVHSSELRFCMDIPFTISHFNRLYKELCKKVKEANSNVVIIGK